MTRGIRQTRLALALTVSAAALVGVPTLTAPATAAITVGWPHGTTAARTVLVDTDGDGLDDLVDGCPRVASSNSTGCPSAARSVSLMWLRSKQRLQAQVSSPVPGCYQRARVALWRVRANRDYKVFGGTTSFGGRIRVEVARGSTYYVTVSPSYASGIAECGQAESRKVRAPRG